MIQYIDYCFDCLVTEIVLMFKGKKGTFLFSLCIYLCVYLFVCLYVFFGGEGD